jgi:peptidoglycan/LPS O-acetylase OafA/YrhL
VLTIGCQEITDALLASLIRCVGGLLTTWSCVNSSAVSPLFTNRFAHYLGKISFALYLTHGCMIRSIGYVIIGTMRRMSGAMTRETTSLHQLIGFWLLGYLLMLPFFAWAADLFRRAVDVPSVSFARWIERKLSVGVVKQIK